MEERYQVVKPYFLATRASKGRLNLEIPKEPLPLQANEHQDRENRLGFCRHWL
jgi:hypothetical protein